MAGYKRRKIFIDKEFQGKYIFKVFLGVVAASILFSLLIVFFSYNTLSITYGNYHLRLGTTPSLLADRLLSAQWLFILLGGIAGILVALFLSHRVAGPFYRFEKMLDAMIEKDLSGRIRLRKKDEGKVLSEKINAFADMLCDALLLAEKITTQIGSCCDTVKSTEGGLKGAMQQDSWAIIQQHNDQMRHLLKEFKLERDKV